MNTEVTVLTYEQLPESGSWKLVPSMWRNAIQWYLQYMKTTTVRLPELSESGILSRQRNYGSFNALQSIFRAYGWLLNASTLSLTWNPNQLQNTQAYLPLTALLVFQQFLTETETPYVFYCPELRMKYTVGRDVNGNINEVGHEC